MSDDVANRAIGIFDSGMGGLTVMRAIRQRLPQERLVYLGDTARLPYGTKSGDTVTRYAVQATKALARHNVKAVVVACNTASAVAMPALIAAMAPLPVLGVVEPGARAAVAATRSGAIGVIATEGTVRGGAYPRAIHALKPDAIVTQKACSLFVPLAEEGWTDGPIAELTAQRYLQALFDAPPGIRPDTLVLGCTHFPVLTHVIAKAITGDVLLVDSAATAAAELEDILDAKGLRRRGATAAPVFLATDAPDRFAKVGGMFLGEVIATDHVALVDLSE